jgi:hypothetical protein
MSLPEVLVRTVATLRKQFDAYRLHHPVESLAAITDDGLVLGAGTQLVRMEVDQSAQTELALTRDEARLFALLEVAFRRPASPNILRHIQNASLHWGRGDKALANPSRIRASAAPRGRNGCMVPASRSLYAG